MRAAAGINFTSGLLLWCGIFFVPLFVQQVRASAPRGQGSCSCRSCSAPPSAPSSPDGWSSARPLPDVADRRRRADDWSDGPPRHPRPTARRWSRRAVRAAPRHGVGFVMQPSLLAVQNGVARAPGHRHIDRAAVPLARATPWACRSSAGCSTPGSRTRPRPVHGRRARSADVVLAALVGLVVDGGRAAPPERPLREHTAFDEQAAEAANGPLVAVVPSSRSRAACEGGENAF